DPSEAVVDEDDRAPGRDLGRRDRERVERALLDLAVDARPVDVRRDQLLERLRIEQARHPASGVRKGRPDDLDRARRDDGLPPEQPEGHAERVADPEAVDLGQRERAPQLDEARAAPLATGGRRDEAGVDTADARPGDDREANRAAEVPRQLVEDVREDARLVRAARAAAREDDRELAAVRHGATVCSRRGRPVNDGRGGGGRSEGPGLLVGEGAARGRGEALVVDHDDVRAVVAGGVREARDRARAVLHAAVAGLEDVAHDPAVPVNRVARVELDHVGLAGVPRDRVHDEARGQGAVVRAPRNRRCGRRQRGSAGRRRRARRAVRGLRLQLEALEVRAVPLLQVHDVERRIDAVVEHEVIAGAAQLQADLRAVALRLEDRAIGRRLAARRDDQRHDRRVVDPLDELAGAALADLLEEALERDGRAAEVDRAVVVELAADAVLDASRTARLALDADVGRGAVEALHPVDGERSGRGQERERGGDADRARERSRVRTEAETYVHV